MNVWSVLRKSTKHLILGVIGLGCSIVCVMGYYPIIPAYFTANYLMGEASLFLYVGLLVGMGYFLPLTAMVKYAFSLVIIAIGIRFYIWANRRCSSIMGGFIAGMIVTIMNVSGHLFTRESGREVLLGFSEGVLIMGGTMVIYYLLSLLTHFGYALAESLKNEESVTEYKDDRQEEKVAAFATAVDGLSAAFSSMNRAKEKTVAENVGILEQEITGKLCTSCDGCAVCWQEGKMDFSLRIRQMLQAVIAHHPREEIVESAYLSSCPRYPYMVEEAISAFGRLELNQAWYRRLLENRMAIAGQLDAIAGFMNEWNKSDKLVDKENRMLLSKIAFEVKERGLLISDLHLYEDGEKKCYMQARVSSKWGGGIPSKNYLKALEKATGKSLRLEKDAKSILTKDETLLTVYEDTRFYTMIGISSKKKNGSSISGDNFTMFSMDNGRDYLCLSDGMGSGGQASKESELVVDLLQKFVEAGFKEDMAIRMMNSAMVLQGENNTYSTLDLAKINRYDGELIIYKIGAAASFIRRGAKTEFISSATLPTGAKLDTEPEVIRRSLQEGDFLVMVSDGVLEYLHVKNPEEKFAEILSDIETDNASALAQKALERVLVFTGGYAMDDMTIMVAGMWEK